MERVSFCGELRGGGLKGFRMSGPRNVVVNNRAGSQIVSNSRKKQQREEIRPTRPRVPAKKTSRKLRRKKERKKPTTVEKEGNRSI